MAETQCPRPYTVKWFRLDYVRDMKSANSNYSNFIAD